MEGDLTKAARSLRELVDILQRRTDYACPPENRDTHCFFVLQEMYYLFHKTATEDLGPSNLETA